MKWVAPRGGFDEVFDPRGEARPHYAPLIAILESFTTEDVERRERLQQMALRTQGVTFTVYGEKEGLERIFPFDFVPRIIPAAEWKRLQDGLVQRITTLNLFLADVYHEQKCLKDRVVPPELVLSRKEYKRPLLGLMPARKIFTHVVGTDIIRNDRGEYLVLEDNCRVPSGVSYVLENRNLLSRVFPEFLGAYPVRPIKDYPTLLLETLRFVAPRRGDDPVVVLEEQRQVALDVSGVLEVAHLHDRHELGELLADLLQRVVVGGDDDGHPRQIGIFRAADDQRVDVEPAGRKHPGHVREHPRLVHDQR